MYVDNFKYKCDFPLCNYSSSDLGSFDSHHIIPKSKGGSNKKFNRVLLCPNCHRKIYIENFKNGIHSVKHNDSIIIIGKIVSNVGDILHYKRCNNNKEYYWFKKEKEESLAND